MKLILTPYWIAESCFLKEALLWAGFYRYPKSEILPDRVDFRFDFDRQQEYEPMIIDDYGYIESEEAVRVGLPPNPEWEAIFDDHDMYMADADLLDRFLKMDISEFEKEKFRQGHIKAVEQAKAQAEWDKKYEEYIEVVESKLFVALKDGTLKAWGKPAPIEDDVFTTGDDHEEIPASFWRLNDIDWPQSASKNEKGHYHHIFVNTNQLFSLFPSPQAEEVKTVSLVAGQYVLSEEQPRKNLKNGKRGRPAMDWDSFHVQVSARLIKDGLPEKQEAFISDMQKWCLQNWGFEPGRSTILQKISPYYKKHVRK